MCELLAVDAWGIAHRLEQAPDGACTAGLPVGAERLRELSRGSATPVQTVTHVVAGSVGSEHFLQATGQGRDCFCQGLASAAGAEGADALDLVREQFAVAAYGVSLAVAAGPKHNDSKATKRRRCCSSNRQDHRGAQGAGKSRSRAVPRAAQHGQHQPARYHLSSLEIRFGPTIEEAAADLSLSLSLFLRFGLIFETANA